MTRGERNAIAAIAGIIAAIFWIAAFILYMFVTCTHTVAGVIIILVIIASIFQGIFQLLADY